MPYPTGPQLLKGALIYFGAPMLIPLPNIVVFQYNPDSMTRTLTPWQPLKKVVEKRDKNNQITNESELAAYHEELANLSLPFDPQETFSLVLEFDASDGLEQPEAHPVTVLVGVAERLAAIEMLLYPPDDGGGLLGSVAASVSVSAGGVSVGGDAGGGEALTRRDAPVVLFFWGPGRIVPVRIMSLSIEEQQYSPMLYPIRAKATIGLRVLDDNDLLQVTGDKATGPTVSLAKACYAFTMGQKKALAAANLVETAVDAVTSILPI